MWAQMSSWPVVLTVIGLLLAAGGGVVTLSPPDYTTAKICFSLAALIVIPPLGYWIISAKASTGERLIVSLFVFGALGVIWAWSMLWIEDREIKIIETKVSQKIESPLPVAPQKEPQTTATEPIKPSEPAPPFREKVEPSTPLTAPRKQRIVPPADIKKELPNKLEAPKEKLADILIRKCPPIDPALERRPKFFLQEWLNVIKKVNGEMTKQDLQTVMRIRVRLRDGISDDAHIAEARFTLHCLESEGYIRIMETSDPLQGHIGVVINNLTFEFVTEEKRNEFLEAL